MAEEETSPLVVGTMTGRSGSTWMMALLSTSNEVAMDRVHPYESFYIAYLLHLVRHVAEPPSPVWSVEDMVRGDPTRFGPPPFHPSGALGSAVDRADISLRATRHLWLAFSESLGATLGVRPRYWAEKFVVGTDRLARSGVAVKLVRLLRDPRDVVASILAFDAKRGFYGFGRKPAQGEEEYVRWLVGRMGTRLAEIYSREPGVDAMTVRYEDMVSDLEGVAARLGEWLAVELDPAVLPDARLSEHATSPSTEASVGRWRGYLDERYVELVAESLGPQLAEHGYDLAS